MSGDNTKQRIADAFGKTTDPLAEFDQQFKLLEQEGIDPFEDYINKVQIPRGNGERTINHYKRTIRLWRDHMADIGRHPACPNVVHVKQFARKSKGDIEDSTIRKRLRRLKRIFEWWQSAAEYPHDTDYNPFDRALSEVQLESEPADKPPNLSIEEIREIIHDISHVGDRAMIGLPFKLATRPSEFGNIQFPEVNIDHPEINAYYPNLGTHPMVADRPNSIYIPPDRDQNKRKRPTVLPLDQDARKLLVDWLLVRPSVDVPYVFLTHNGKKVERNDLGHIWRKYWHPEYEYGEDDEFRSISPGFGRHRFSTYWRKDQDLNPEHVKYMRGDMTGNSLGDSPDALDHYVHTYYPDIKNLYLENMFQFYL